MILVRTNPKVALLIVALTLATSIFTVWMVTRTTDKVAQQGIELQREANQSVNDAIQKSAAATKDAQADAAAVQKDVSKAIDDAQAKSGASDDVQAQIDAAQAQLEAASK